MGDPFVAALARYVEALHRRYPGGVEQMRREAAERRLERATLAVVKGGRRAA
jgi:hypothetical protein